MDVIVSANSLEPLYLLPIYRLLADLQQSIWYLFPEIFDYKLSSQTWCVKKSFPRTNEVSSRNFIKDVENLEYLYYISMEISGGALVRSTGELCTSSVDIL